MPYIDKNTKKWVGEFQIGGKPHIELRKRKKGFPTREAAKEWEEAEREAYLNPPDPNVLTSLKPCVSKYLRFCEKRTKQNTCRYKTAIYIQMFKFWHHDPIIEDLTPLLFSDFLDHVYDVKGGATANRYLREINSLLNWCVENRLLPENPAANVEKYYADPFKKYVPPAEDLDLVEAEAGPLEKDIIQTVFYSLARAGEIRNMKFSDCNFENNTLTIWTRKRKGGALESDDIEMSHNLKEILYRRYTQREKDQEYVFPGLQGGKFPKRTMDRIMPTLCKKAGVKPFGFHSIRHHSAALLATQLPLLAIQAILRHKRASTTDSYLRSIVKISTKGISVLDKIQDERKKQKEVNVISFEDAANHKKK